MQIISENILEAEILDILEDGLRKVRFKYDGIFNEILDKDRNNATSTIYNRKD